MKKSLIASMLCVVALPVLLCGCGTTPLKDAPTQTASTVVNGSALTYNNADHKYIYFANSYIDASSITSLDAKLTAFNRIKLDENGKIVKDENKMPTQQEQVIQKIVGSENNFMYSSGDNIFFASPSRDIDASSGKHHYEFNQYFKMKTDNTGLKCFYTSSSVVTQQTVLKIDNKEYLILVDDNKLIKIDLSTLKATTLAEDFNAVVFADKYQVNGDQIAYYTTDVPQDQSSSKTGNLLYAVDIVTGENLGGKEDGKNLAINETATRTITLKKVFNGELYFTFAQTSFPTYYAHSNANNFSYNNTITSLANLSEFEVVLDNNSNIQYVYVDSDANLTKLQTSDGEIGDVLIESKIDVFFTYNEYVYFGYVDGDAGIYRISTLDKEVQTITTITDYKTTNMSFDEQYLYFYAKNTSNTTGTYYMHRVQANGVLEPEVELLSIVDEQDKPTTETEN